MSADRGFIRRLASTPVSQLLRGRILPASAVMPTPGWLVSSIAAFLAGRPLSRASERMLGPNRRELAARLNAAELPDALKQIVADLVRRTRLWRLERANVQAELIAHFRDGIDAGATPEQLQQQFGDVRTAAKLIRRAKIRNRSLFWHGKRWLLRGALVVVAIYGVLFLRYWMGRPTIRVDYLAMQRAQALAVPTDQRAWPLYRDALRTIFADERLWDETKKLQTRMYHDDVFAAEPGSEGFPELVAYVARRREMIESIGRATRLPQVGVVVGPGGSIDEPGNPWADVLNKPSLFPEGLSDADAASVAQYVSAFRRPDWNTYWPMARLLTGDARVAAEGRDAERYVRRIHDCLSMARQLSGDRPLNEQLIGISIAALAMNRLDEQLTRDPSLLTEAQLIELAHLLPEGHTGSDAFDLRYEQMQFRDLVQRVYTDDGAGDGRLTPQVGPYLRWLSASISDAASRGGSAKPGDETPEQRRDRLELERLELMPFVAVSRRDLLAEYDRLVGLWQTELATPLRDLAEPSPSEARVEELRRDTFGGAPRYLLLTRFGGTLGRPLNVSATKLYAQRDAMHIAIACEIYKRQTGTHPDTLDVLVPLYLPTLPEDPIDGRPLRYVIRNGKPVIYSIGVDHVDDGGTMPEPTLRRRQISPGGEFAIGAKRPSSGDWILFPEPRWYDTMLRSEQADWVKTVPYLALPKTTTQSTTQPSAQP